MIPLILAAAGAMATVPITAVMLMKAKKTPPKTPFTVTADSSNTKMIAIAGAAFLGLYLYKGGK